MIGRRWVVIPLLACTTIEFGAFLWWQTHPPQPNWFRFIEAVTVLAYIGIAAPRMRHVGKRPEIIDFRKEPWAAKLAMGFIEQRYPDSSGIRIITRADEPERFVFAVFFNRAGTSIIPTPYEIVAVRKTDGEVAELIPPNDEPYLIAGYR